MKQVKYVGQENGLYISGSPVGDHFTKNEVKEVAEAVYNHLFEKYTNDFEFLSGIPKRGKAKLKPIEKEHDDKIESREPKKKRSKKRK